MTLSPEHRTTPLLSAAEQQSVLNFDPWGERDATYRLLRQGFCVVRGSYECAICFGPIAKGERVWFRAETDDGRAATFRFCPECCWCIAHRCDDPWDDDPDGPSPWEQMDARYELGSKRAREKESGDIQEAERE
jgi:hypothetical protein